MRQSPALTSRLPRQAGDCRVAPLLALPGSCEDLDTCWPAFSGRAENALAGRCARGHIGATAGQNRRCGMRNCVLVTLLAVLASAWPGLAGALEFPHRGPADRRWAPRRAASSGCWSVPRCTTGPVPSVAAGAVLPDLSGFRTGAGSARCPTGATPTGATPTGTPLTEANPLRGSHASRRVAWFHANPGTIYP